MYRLPVETPQVQGPHFTGFEAEGILARRRTPPPHGERSAWVRWLEAGTRMDRGQGRTCWPRRCLVTTPSLSDSDARCSCVGSTEERLKPR